MSSRFKIALSLVAALALAVVLVAVLGDPGAPRSGPGYTLEGDGVGDGGDPATAARGSQDDPRLEGQGNERRADVGPDGGGSLVGARDPEGIDYSDPATREAELRRLFGATAVDWQQVAKIVALMDEPIPDGLRNAFLEGLTIGPRRNQAMFAFAVLRDGSFVEDLFSLLDDTQVVKGARTAVLTALWQMPGGDRDQIVLKLESRLSGDPAQDLPLLNAANRRGGPEAARALAQYLQGVSNPRQVPPHILRSLDLSDPDTAKVFATSMRRQQSPQVMKAMITAASQSGAHGLVDSLVSLDRDGVPDDVRQQVMDALGRIGGTESLDYLLRKAEEPGVFGDRAVMALGTFNSSERGVADALAKALDGAANNPRPRQYKQSLLLALGNSKSPETLRVIGKTLDDGDAQVRLAAVEALGRMAQNARPYVDKLTSVYDRGDDTAKRRVVIALGTIGGDEAIARMEAMLESERHPPSLRPTLQMALRAAKEARQQEREAAGG